MTRAVSLFAAILTGAALIACTPADERDILRINAEARGGAEAIEAVETLRMELEISEPGFTVQGVYVATRDGRMRIDIFADGRRVFTEALNGETAWQMTAGATEGEPVSEEGRQALWRGMIGNMMGLHEIESAGVELVFLPEETIEGRAYRPVELVFPDGFRERRYLDAQTGLTVIERSEYALHPDVDPEQERFETVFSEFHEAGGVVRSFRQETRNMDTGEISQTVIIRSVDINGAIDPAIFERPEG